MEHKTLDLIIKRDRNLFRTVAGGCQQSHQRPVQTDRHPFIIETVSRKLSDYVDCLSRAGESPATAEMEKVNQNDVKLDVIGCGELMPKVDVVNEWANELATQIRICLGPRNFFASGARILSMAQH